MGDFYTVYFMSFTTFSLINSILRIFFVVG